MIRQSASFSMPSNNALLRASTRQICRERRVNVLILMYCLLANWLQKKSKQVSWDSAALCRVSPVSC